MALNQVLDTNYKNYHVKIFYIPTLGYDGNARVIGDDKPVFVTVGARTANKAFSKLTRLIDQELTHSKELQAAFESGRAVGAVVGELEY